MMGGERPGGVPANAMKRDALDRIHEPGAGVCLGCGFVVDGPCANCGTEPHPIPRMSDEEFVALVAESQRHWGIK